MKLVKVEHFDGKVAFINPEYVVSITPWKEEIGLIQAGGTKMEQSSHVHMTNMDATRIKGTPEEIAIALGYEENANAA